METNVEEKPKRERFGPQTLGEEIGNSITHGLMFAAGVVFLILLLIKSDQTVEYVASAIFGASMMMLYLMSCLFHSFKNDTTVKNVFQRFDHLSIYLLIGGTFAPLLLCVVKWPLGLVFFIVQWVLIFIGVVLKAINTQKHHKVHIGLYLAIGWSGILFVPELYSVEPMLCYLILAGGLVYSGGILFYIAKWKFAHFIWHFFCIGGTFLHFLAIYLYVL
ncbi:MAG: hemolysin III family protein [bacterium]